MAEDLSKNTPEKEINASKALRSLIKKAGGFIPLQDYMAFCLSHPIHGYYSTQKPLGKNGDFITAPEISQIFGELIGLWFLDSWESKGCPSKIAFLELGPGRGLLLQDILKAMTLRPALLNALEIHLVEINPHLKQEQIAALKPHALLHHKSLEDALDAIGRTPTFCVANEFFDAFPLDQYIYKEGAWHKRYVTYDETKACFMFKDLIPENHFGNRAFPMKPEPGTIMETAPLVESLFRKLAAHLSKNGGASLIIDYGYDQFGYGDTIQALKKHKSIDIFKDIGQADLTAHVNFATLHRIARNASNLKVHLETQGDFLKGLGIDIRTQKLQQKAQDPKTKENLRKSTNRLIDPNQMGSLFKVLQLKA